MFKQHFFKRLFSLLNWLCPFVKNHTYVGLLLTSLFYWFVCRISCQYQSVLITEAIQYSVLKLIYSDFYLLIIFQIDGCYSNSFPFHRSFRFVYIYNKSSWNFNNDCAKSVDQYGENWHLYYVKSFILWTQNFSI